MSTSQSPSPASWAAEWQQVGHPTRNAVSGPPPSRTLPINERGDSMAGEAVAATADPATSTPPGPSRESPWQFGLPLHPDEEACAVSRAPTVSQRHNETCRCRACDSRDALRYFTCASTGRRPLRATAGRSSVGASAGGVVGASERCMLPPGGVAYRPAAWRTVRRPPRARTPPRPRRSGPSSGRPRPRRRGR